MQSSGKLSIRRILIGFWVVMWIVTPALILFPIGSKPIRAAILFSLGAIWLGALTLFWRLRSVRLICSVIIAVALLLIGLPGRETNQEDLRRECVLSLRSYEGTPYVWGGENSFGIDCSGLVRRGLIEANLKVGLRGMNSSNLREALSLWWFDCSARAMRDRYRDKTEPLENARRINDLNPSDLRPADFAVTADGLHMLAYLGDSTWIEADPNKMKVIVVRVPARDNGWFEVPVVIMRWKQLE